MSGFEVAGAVLGSIPLLISALEHYGRGLSTLQRWRKYERELRSLVRNLKTEKLKLQDVCEKLLIGLVPPSKIEAMINEPLGAMWKETQTQMWVRARLGKSFDIFEDTVTEVKIAVSEMTYRLDSQSGGRVSSEFRRAIFTFSRTQYDDLLKRIRENISSLETMINRTLELEPARKARSQGRFFMLLRDLSRGLHRALKCSLGCSCGHDVSLRLEKRAAAFFITGREEETLSHTVFNLFLSTSRSSIEPRDVTGSNHMTRWEEIRVEPRVAHAPSRAASQPHMVNALQPLSLKRLRTGKIEKSVAFSGATASNTSTQGWSHSNTVATTNCSTLITTGTHAPIQGPPASSISVPAQSKTLKASYLEQISSLCKKIQKSPIGHTTEAYGIIADPTPQTVKQYAVYPPLPSGCRVTPEWSVVSLREILESKNDAPYTYMPYYSRIQIAVVVSSSILQLYGSPWLPGIISSRHIFFISKHGFPIYDHPLVMKSMTKSSKEDEAYEQSDGLPYNTTLLSLGILLVELIIGSTLDSFQATREEGPIHSQLLMHYITAQKLLDQDQAKMPSSNYEAAVRRCLGGLHSGQKDLENEDYCQDVYTGVVALLEKDLEYISHS